jgi:hypothetical protein
MEDEPLDPVRREARGLERESLDRELGHRRAAEFWGRVHLGLGLPSVVLAALAGTSALAEFDNSNLIAAILALAVAVLSALSTFLNPSGTADLHRKASDVYHSICARARQLTTIDPRSDDEIRQSVYELTKEFNDQIAASPQLSSRWLQNL